MVSIGGLGGITKNGKLKKEVKNIDKDIKKLLEEVEKDPFGRGLKYEEYIKLIEKILKEIEKHKKSLDKLYGFKPNDFPELKMVEHLLRVYYEKLEEYKKGRTITIYYKWLEDWSQAVQTNWYKHRTKFK